MERRADDNPGARFGALASQARYQPGLRGLPRRGLHVRAGLVQRQQQFLNRFGR